MRARRPLYKIKGASQVTEAFIDLSFRRTEFWPAKVLGMANTVLLIGDAVSGPAMATSGFRAVLWIAIGWRANFELAVTAWDWPAKQYGLRPPAGPYFEMYVYVDELDSLVSELQKDGVVVLIEPANMPWGERVATIADPDGNPVSLCLASSIQADT
jgi:hypothetical protein